MFARFRPAILSTWLLGIGCGGTPETPHVILITLDTTRADVLAAGPERARWMPQLDALLRESLAYADARTVAPLTLPAHASMLTGLYPPRHRVRGNGPMVLTPTAETLAERARDAGYSSAAFIGSLALDQAYGLAQGFDVYDQPQRAAAQQSGVISERPAAQVIDSALSWLDRRADDRPIFLWVHLFDPHTPYDADAACVERAGGDRYRAQFAQMDVALGRLIDALRISGVLAKSFVAVVGDHGESLGEHSEDTHGLLCYDATLRVPFFLRYPDLHRAGETSAALVSVVDVQPTLLEAMGLAPEAGIDGQSLYRRRDPESRGLYFESFEGWRIHGWSPLAGWIDAKGKYIHSSRPEFYDVSADVAELASLDGDAHDSRPYLAAIEALLRKRALSSAVAADLDEQRRAQIQSLGYTASEHAGDEFPSPLARSDRPSPAERADQARAIESTSELMLAGHFRQAADELEELVRRNPFSILAHDRLIRCRMELGEWERALELLRARLALPPESIATHRDLATCLRALGREGEAIPHVRRSLELLIEWSERRGELDQAEQYRRILAASPGK